MELAENSEPLPDSCTVSEDDTVIIDPGRSVITMVTPEEAELTVRDFVRYTGLYVIMSVSLGTSKDSGYLREDMRQIRRQAYEFARQGKTNLVPWMIAAHSDARVQRLLERVFFVFCACLEYFCSQLVKTRDLLTEFSIVQAASNNHSRLQIATGLQDTKPCGWSKGSNGGLPEGRQFSSSIGNLRAGGLPSNSHRKHSSNMSSVNFCESEDVECLQREISSIRDIIGEIHSSVAINAWAIETDLNVVVNTSELSLNTQSSDEGGSKPVTVCGVDAGQSFVARVLPRTNQNVTVSVKRHRRRILCIVVIVLVTLLLAIIVLGVCITLLT